MQYNIGDLVKWYIYYADGIVKQAGIGVIVGKEKQAGFEFKKVYRLREQDIEMFSDFRLETIGDK